MSAPHVTNGERHFPPIAWLSTGALVVVIMGGIVMASYAPRRPPLGVAGSLLALAVVLLAAVAVILARLRDFAWATFTKVFKWALLAYVVEAGVIEFSFVRNHTSGTALAIVTGMLVVFGVSVPTTIAFTVARYADEPRGAPTLT